MSHLHDPSSADNVLNPEEVQAHLAAVSEWSSNDDATAISRTWAFENFMQSISFVQGVAMEAEELNHHPDIFIAYKKVTLTLTTHSAGGLTEKDFMLAGQIDRMEPPSLVETERFLAG